MDRNERGWGRLEGGGIVEIGRKGLHRGWGKGADCPPQRGLNQGLRAVAAPGLVGGGL